VTDEAASRLAWLVQPAMYAVAPVVLTAEQNAAVDAEFAGPFEELRQAVSAR
jgi:hypothetical protein